LAPYLFGLISDQPSTHIIKDEAILKRCVARPKTGDQHHPHSPRNSDTESDFHRRRYQLRSSHRIAF
jgi:hypothetical protein